PWPGHLFLPDIHRFTMFAGDGPAGGRCRILGLRPGRTITGPGHCRSSPHPRSRVAVHAEPRGGGPARPPRRRTRARTAGAGGARRGTFAPDLTYYAGSAVTG